MKLEDYSAVEFVKEILARAYKYDDKPHQLYSCIRAMALKFEDDSQKRDEIVRLMEKEYQRDRSKEK